MSDTNLRNRPLLQLYYRYVGEPERMRDVYGYWLFLLGSLSGFFGIGLYLFEQTFAPGNFAIREAAIMAAAVGLVIALFGIVVLLPVRRNGIFASIAGLVIAFVGVGLFYTVYPQAWYVPPDYSAEIITVYGTGIMIIAGVAVLVPIITGEKGLLVEPEIGIGSDAPPILLGKTTQDAFFGIFETPRNEWTWRLIYRDAIAESEIVTRNDTDTRIQVEDVRDAIGAAGLLDLTTASFRLYQTVDGAWRWSLVTADGSVVAVSNSTAPARDEVESTVTFLGENLAESELIEIQRAAFDIYEDAADRWQWRLLDEQRQPLAQAEKSEESEAAAEAATETFVEQVGSARLVSIENIGIELIESDSEWSWHVLTPADDILVSSTDSYAERQDAEANAHEVIESLQSGNVIEYGQSGFELVPVSNGWTWRLRDDTDDIIAMNHDEPASDEATIRSLAERTQSALGEATVIDYEHLEFEVFPAGNAWRWRLVDAERNQLAESVDTHDDFETANQAAEHVKQCIDAADLIEFEQAAFQQYESNGEWRWRLIDEDGQVLADSGEEYGSKEAVQEGMSTLKEHAPDAEILEIETAAFEIYLDDDEFGWRLIDDGGKLIAAATASYSSRQAAREAVQFLTDHNDTTAIYEMDAPAFQLFDTEDGWGVRLVDVDGAILATATDETATKDAAQETLDHIRDAGIDAPIEAFGSVTVKLRNGAGWQWELIDPDREFIAEGEQTYENRADAMADINRLIDGGQDAPTFTLDDGVIWATSPDTDDSWQWQLLDPERTVLAESGKTYENPDALSEAVETIKSRAPDATRFEIETAAFEIVRRDEGWQWRVIDEEETVLAVDPGYHDDRGGVTEAIERARSSSVDASIIEIDEPVFEFHERDDGWVWRLLDENGEPIAESVRAHETRQAAREEMRTAKEYGPEGEAVVTW